MASINEHVDKIAVKGDSRIRRETANINGKTYGGCYSYSCSQNAR
jgi:hypothetical protein